ncbi:MAG: HEAT repeat domain-containing protein, partial [Elusimicrobia bacterium]|nr:HEAT repeat domain-containing protein [Elusimicrobiota bacterium]
MASGQTEPSISARQAAEEVRVLREGDWNERVHATHELGDLGADGLPGLRVAAEDADWQVRMTAVHLMGRVGEAAVPDLARVLRSEPCREVRLTALHWLGAIGGEKASEALRGGLSDESGMVRLMGRYWLDKSAGRPEGAEPDAAAAEDEDLKFCEASPEPRRAPWASEKRTAPKATDDDSGSHVVTPDPPRPAVAPTALVPTEAAKKAAGNDASDRERLKELDALLSPDSGKDGDALSAAPARRSPRAELTERKERKPPESMPRGAPGLPPRPPTETAGAAIMPDAGTGRPQNDPFPALLKLLKDSDPAKRARAADDLGKRGAL